MDESAPPQADPPDRPHSGGPGGRLTEEQRARLAAAPPEDRERILQEVRGQHVRRSLGDAVAEGRLSQADADSVLERISRGEDVHSLRRELRGLGVLPGSADRPRREAVRTFPGPVTSDDASTGTGAARGPDQVPAGSRVPGWVKGFAIVGVVLLLLIVLMLLTGHGPGEHMEGVGRTPATGQSLQAGVPVGDRS